MHHGEPIGVVLRTRDDTKPVIVSVGHRLSLPSAAEIVMTCAKRFRLPEPTRLADKLVARAKEEQPARRAFPQETND